jgi:hypothetical protein
MVHPAAKGSLCRFTEWRVMKHQWNKKRLWCVSFALLLVGMVAVAQPQAPVTWGETRQIDFDNGAEVRQIVMLGDTLVFSGLYSTGIFTAHSYDNGITISPWLQMDQPESASFLRITGSAGRVFAFIADQSFNAWMRMSLDGGATWGNAQGNRTNIMYHGFASGARVIRVLERMQAPAGTRAATSSDGGQSWSPDRVIDSVYMRPYTYDCIAITQGHMFVLGSRFEQTDPLTYIATSSDFGATWSSFAPLPAQPQGAFPYGYSIVGDTASEKAIVMALRPGSGLFAQQRPWIYRTEDGGETWSNPVPLTDSTTLNTFYNGAIFGAGRLVGAAWPVVQQNSPGSILKWRFSADHGRDWYPEQIIVPDVHGCDYATGQFIGNEARIYWWQWADSAFTIRAYGTASGTIDFDSLPPEITPVSLPPDTVAVGDSLRFEIRVTDNDTISDVHLIVTAGSEFMEQMEMGMSAQGTRVGSWLVPAEGLYRYRFEAEDFWENIAINPDSGTYHLVTEHWQAARSQLSLDSSFDFHVFPNPSNGWPSIDLSYWSNTRMVLGVTIYNLLGQLVLRRVVEPGQDRVSLSSGFSSGSSSGIYIVCVGNNDFQVRRKLLILR